MADTNTPDTRMNQDKSNEQMRSQGSEEGSNQTLRHEQAKNEVSGRNEKSAIGGGDRSQTGEPGRARNELDEKNRNETAGSR